MNALEKNLSPKSEKNLPHLNPGGELTRNPSKRLIVMSEKGVPHPSVFDKDIDATKYDKNINQNGVSVSDSETTGHHTFLRLNRVMEQNRGIHSADSEEVNKKNKEMFEKRAIPPKNGKYKEPMSPNYLKYMIANSLEAGHSGVDVDHSNYDTKATSINQTSDNNDKTNLFLADANDETIKSHLRKDNRLSRYIIHDSSNNSLHSDIALSLDQALEYLHFPEHHDVSHLHLIPIEKARTSNFTKESSLNIQQDYQNSGSRIDINKLSISGNETNRVRDRIPFTELKNEQKKIKRARDTIQEKANFTSSLITKPGTHPSETNPELKRYDEILPPSTDKIAQGKGKTAVESSREVPPGGKNPGTSIPKDFRIPIGGENSHF